MASLATHISWTDTTWNPTTGCTPISAGCDNCYAKAMTDRLFGGGFETVQTHADRLAQVAAFRPLRQPDGTRRPRMVFVNSMSDLMHDRIPDAFRDQVFERIEATPAAVFQVLTKRPITLRRYIEARYRGRGVPAHLWLGVSVEDDRVRGRIDALRRLKDAVGDFCAFLSVEPLIGDPTHHDYRGMDWVLIGGESGPRARPCEAAWVGLAIRQARAAGAAVWFKQWGIWPNNPLYREADGPTHAARVRSAIKRGEQMAAVGPDPRQPNRARITGEKGGATFDGQAFREMPPAYRTLTLGLSGSLGL